MSDDTRARVQSALPIALRFRELAQQYGATHNNAEVWLEELALAIMELGQRVARIEVAG